ncbi:MAG TPA: FKBP-type peptidyl-prolyl cis-trans isomerase, partial [Methanomethylovorans sp.]|nr:FKBP-type peptidyl-prolyl cis-trans isomerase [Methanomethylovorans sp.]
MVKVDFLLRRDGILGVKLGDIVAVEYVGTLDNGGVFDSSESQGGPLEFKVGGG